jgi:hypothetical protein
MSRWLLLGLLNLLGLLLLSGPVSARTLSVGAGQPFSLPSAAAWAAQDGDIVLIEPGVYYDCAVWTQSHLVIAGAGPGTVITDMTCQGKALFIITGHDTTVRNLILARARTPDRNGAGIRQEGQGVALQRVKFLNDEVGLLAGAAAAGAISISECDFAGGGIGGERPTFAVNVGAASLLRIEHSSFKGVKGGQVNTSADRTELSGNEITTGTGEEPAVAVQSTRGQLVMEDNLLSLSPNSPRPAAAVLVTGTDHPELRRNELLNGTGHTAALLLDWTNSEPVLEGNRVQPGDVVLSTRGLWRFRISAWFHGTSDVVHAIAAEVRRELVPRFRGSLPSEPPHWWD